MKTAIALSITIIMLIGSIGILTPGPSAPANISSVTTDGKTTYGLFIMPDYITNTSRAASVSAATGCPQEGVGTLYARLMQHSQAEFLNWQQIENDTADVDVTIFWSPKYVTDATLSSVVDYATVNNCVFIGYTPFRQDELGVARSQTVGYYADLINLSGLSDVAQAIDNRATTGTGDKALALESFGSYVAGEIYNTPWLEYSSQRVLLGDYSLSGVHALMNYSSSVGVDTNKAIAIGRDVGGVRNAFITGLYPTTYDTELHYSVCVWAGQDEVEYNLSMWPDGNILAAYARFDDYFTYSVASLMDNMSLPYAAYVNNPSAGEIEPEAMAFVNLTDQYMEIGMHGANHTYSFWTSDYNSTAEYLANLQDNAAYIEAITGEQPYLFGSPGSSYSKNLTSGLNAYGVTLGSTPEWQLYATPSATRAYDLDMLPYQIPYAENTGTPSTWLHNAPYGWSASNSFVDNTISNMCDYAHTGVWWYADHYYAYGTDAEFVAAATARFEPIVENPDIWLAIPTDILDRMQDRLNLDYYASGDNITVTNNGANSMSDVGFNIFIDEDVESVTVDGVQTTNVRYSDGRLFFWADALEPGESTTFKVTYGVPDTYALFNDYHNGELSPLIGYPNTHYICNDNNSEKSFILDGLYHPFDEETVITPDGVVITLAAHRDATAFADLQIVPTSTITIFNLTYGDSSIWSWDLEGTGDISITLTSLDTDLGYRVYQDDVLVERQLPGYDNYTFVITDGGEFSVVAWDAYESLQLLPFIIVISIVMGVLAVVFRRF